MNKTKIPWVKNPNGSQGYTWNPILGCSHASEGCLKCYAETTAHQKKRHPNAKIRAAYEGLTDDSGKWQGGPRFMLDRLDQPLKVRKPFRVFVCSMSDLFHEDVPEAAIAEIFGVMAVANNVFQGKSDGFKNQTIGGKVVARWPNMKSGPHSFILLTKRTDRMRDLLLSGRFRESVSAAAYRHAIDRVDAGHLAHAISSRNEWGRCYEPGSLWPLPNVWIGVTAENQARYDERVPILMSIPAKVRFVSIEPMLGPVLTVLHPKPEWIIAGPENGSGARPCNPKWIEDVKDQCEFGRIPFFDKRDTEGAVRQMPWSLEGII